MAIINTESLPLKYKYKFPSVEINPFTYKGILDYLDGKPNDKSNLYLYDMRKLLSENPELGELLLPDFEYLVFLRKAISINSKKIELIDDVKCPHCGTVNRYVFTSDDLKFNRPTEEIIYNGLWIELTSGKFLCKIPTVNKFLKVAELTQTYGLTKHIDLIKSMAMVNEFELNPNGVESAILGAREEDITVVSTAYNLLFSSLKPVNKLCGNDECKYSKDGGMPIEITALVGNVFRSLLLSRPIIGDKIHT